MSDIMASAGLDISSFRNSLNQLNESTQKVSQGLKGNMLALGAGVAGVALVLTQSLMESQKNFTQLTKDAEGFSDQLANISASGGVGDIVGGLTTANQQMAQLTASAQEAAGFMESTGSMISSWFGGDDAVARIEKLSELTLKLQDQRFAAEQEIVRLLKIESEVIGLRNKGEDYSADVKEEQLRLEKEISAWRQKAASGAIAEATADKAAAVAAAKSKLKLQKMLAEEEKKSADAIARANEKLVAADQRAVDFETSKLSLKKQSAAQAGKIADAEFRLSKETKGTAGWYEKAAELAKERLKLEEQLTARAQAYNKSTSAGRRFDREQAEQQRENERGRKRLDEQIKRENRRAGGNADAAPVPAGGGVAPKPIQQPNAPNAPAIGVAQPAQQVMRVQTIIVDRIQPK